MVKKDFVRNPLKVCDLVDTFALTKLSIDEEPRNSYWDLFDNLDYASLLTSCSTRCKDFLRYGRFPFVHIRLISGNIHDRANNKEMFNLFHKDFFTSMRFWYESTPTYTHALSIVSRIKNPIGDYMNNKAKTLLSTNIKSVEIKVFPDSCLRITDPRLHMLSFRFYSSSEGECERDKLKLESLGFKSVKSI